MRLIGKMRSNSKNDLKRRELTFIIWDLHPMDYLKIIHQHLDDQINLITSRVI